jgi:DNA (cytosine-5)-methyltransferase 1
MGQPIPVVDIFAGPGGLGEGFASCGNGDFHIAVSAEMDPIAHRTLQLRAFFRYLDRRQRRTHYYPFVRSGAVRFDPGTLPRSGSAMEAWRAATQEARNLRLGHPPDDEELSAITELVARRNTPWVLIGGPPCQAYSLAGRVRNRGKKDYVPEKDERHFLYGHYLKLLSRFGPAAFVMENVKGILSSRINGSGMFARILADLRDVRHEGNAYVLMPLITSDSLLGDDPRDFVIRAEEFGIPQARHRVIILGVREDVLRGRQPTRLVQSESALSLEAALAGLPPLRSSLSAQGADRSTSAWARTVIGEYNRVARECRASGQSDVAAVLLECVGILADCDLTPDGRGMRVDAAECRERALRFGMSPALCRHLFDPELDLPLSHEARGHMTADLGRYGFVSAFLAARSRSPVSRDFPSGLAPEHGNWHSGHFADRFRAQAPYLPCSTVTSHISKDGHHFIHWDPVQCRSFTVREAARAQTFPDNYCFMGNRTQQYVQVGNAVPPFLARKIAEIVGGMLR